MSARSSHSEQGQLHSNSFRCPSDLPSLRGFSFTKMKKVLATKLAEREISVLMYLNDWLVRAPSPHLLQQALRTVISEMESMGFLINHKKSQLTPTQEIVWLGISWDTVKTTWCLSKENHQRIQGKVLRTRCSKKVTRIIWES